MKLNTKLECGGKKIESNKKCEDITALARRMNRVKLNNKNNLQRCGLWQGKTMQMNISLHKCLIFFMYIENDHKIRVQNGGPIWRR